MKARVAHNKLLSPLQICLFFTLIAITYQAHAEYYLVYDSGEPAMVELYGGSPHHYVNHHARRHHWASWHRRNSYNIQVYYFLRPDCCGAGYYAPVMPVAYVPVRERYYDNGVVYMAQPDMYSGSQINDVNYGYDSDQRTGDDVDAGMDIDHY